MVVLLVIAAAAIAYQVLAIIAAFRHKYRSRETSEYSPAVSVLKPVRGLDPGFRQAIESHVRQEYPEFEILFGFSDADDPVVPELERLRFSYPEIPIRVIHCSSPASNLKVGILAELAKEARHSILLVSDSDILVPEDYLRKVIEPLQDPLYGLVTCLYRADSRFWPGRFEALGIATDFAPGVLVAPLTGVSDFALGSTMVFRFGQLEAIGGFEAMADYLADDYQLGKRISQLGTKIYLSEVVVETLLSGKTWAGVWAHQVRWRRTIRYSKGLAYLGIPVTFATLWAVLAAAFGLWWIALPLLAARMAAGLITGLGILGCRVVRRYWYWIPIRDLFEVAVWVAGLIGSDVEWRGRRLRLSREGKIIGPVQ